MIFIYMRKSAVFLFLVTFYLSGCVSHKIDHAYKNGYEIKGDVYGRTGAIPANSMVTISITRKNIEGEKDNVYQEYNFETNEESRRIPFRLTLVQERSKDTLPFNISVRIEKEGELVMMSDKATLLSPHSAQDKLTLGVTGYHVQVN